MATHFGQIDSYFINMLSPKNYGGKRIMNLTGSFGKAILWFLPSGTSLPNNRQRPNQNIFDVYYSINDWEPVLDVMRNEKPVYFNYQDTTNAAQIYTGSEPVGEEEAD